MTPKVNKKDLKIKRNAENERDQVIRELYKPVRINYPRRRIELKSINDQLQIDLADMNLLKKDAKNYAYFLCAVNPFTKKVYTRALFSKKAKEVSNAVESVLKESKIKFKLLFHDKGTEFYNSNMTELLKKYNMKQYSTYTRIKASHCERMIRTIKTILYKGMEFEGSNNWVPLLPIVTKTINSTPHSRLKIIPNKVTTKDEDTLRKIYSTPRVINRKTKFQISDKVRISNPPIIFRRAFYPYWSPEIYTIVQINYKIPHIYRLADYEGNILQRTFYEQELQKTRYPDIWLIERILQERNGKCKVRWLNFSAAHDSWVNCKEIGKGKKNVK